MTLNAVESGELAPTMGTYLRVMSALGLSGDLALLASGASRNYLIAEPAPKFTASISDAKHNSQDLQSLLLHEEAVKLLRKQPELIARALDTLEEWRKSGNVHSRVLWDEWSVILHRRDWRRAVARTRRSNELRQASPLPTILPPDIRDRVLKEVRALSMAETVPKPTNTSQARKPR